MKRHPSVLFGVLLVGIGVLLLLQQTGAIDEDVGLGPLILMVVGGWLFLSRLIAGSRWGNAGGYVFPLVLLGIGLVLFLRDVGAIDEDVEVWPVVLIAIGVGVVLTAIPRSRGRSDGRSEQVAVPLQGASEARVVIKHGAGELRVRGGAPTGSVLEGRFGAGVRTQVDRHGDRVDVVLDASPESWFPWSWGSRGGMNWEVELGEEVSTALELKSGANEAELDLEDVLVRDLRVETGASETRITLPAKGVVRARIKGGAAGFKVRVPDGVAARIRVNAGVSSVKVDESRFPRAASGWESPGFDAAADRVELDVDVGAADVRIS